MDDAATIKAAAAGDDAAFEHLTSPLMRPLRSYILRTVTHPDDADDILQDTLAKAHRSLGGFRGEASFKNWMYTIATSACLDHLRKRKRWRVEAHLEAGQLAEERPDVLEQLGTLAATPDFVYSVREHVAFCFSCIGRVLQPEEHTAVMLREVYGFPNREAAKLMGVSESVFRHRLRAGRSAMVEAFADLCALINKKGICHMCLVLRGKVPADRRGEPLARIGDDGDDGEALFDERARITADADLAEGTTRAWHDAMFAMMSAQEEGRPG